MFTDVLIGLQWGDEGKGKIVDYLASRYQIVARFQGGPNAGHTLKIDNQTVVLHTIPSGIFHENIQNVIGNGVVIDPITFKNELLKLHSLGLQTHKNLLISSNAHLILPTHKALDAASERKKGSLKIGSTLRGIGPTYMDKTGRNGLRVGDILSPDFQGQYQFLKEKHLEILRQFEDQPDISAIEEEWFEGIEVLRNQKIIESVYFLNQAMIEGKKILAEGAQGTMLDIDFGTYPFVTSSNTVTSGACIGLGIPPTKINQVWGISKAYCTRVGSGAFPTELHDETGELLRQTGGEFGATTGRPRRCGWIDLPALKYAIIINGLTQLILTKIDVLNDFETIKACTHYNLNGSISDEVPYDLNKQNIVPIFKNFKGWKCNVSHVNNFQDLPSSLSEYIQFLENYLKVPIAIISNGPKREDLIIKQPHFSEIN